MYPSLLCLMLILSHSSSLVRTQENASSSSQSQPKSIFILAGQSNMSGRGGVVNGTWDHFVPYECESNPKILRLNSALTWENAREPLHGDIDVNRTCGVGPAMSFSNVVLARDSGIGTIGLVPCAIGGTNIDEWRRGGRLYGQMVARARAAAYGGGGGIIRAVLWYQGESDTERLEDARTYRRRVEAFFNDVRSDLNMPSLPIIQVALASGQGPYTEKVREAQLAIDLRNVRCVDAKGLGLEPDELHLTTPSQAELGQMMAEAFLQINAPLPVKSGAAKCSRSFFLDLFLGRVFVSA